MHFIITRSSQSFVGLNMGLMAMIILANGSNDNGRHKSVINN